MEEILKEINRKLDEIQESLRKFTDRQLTRGELAAEWKVSDETIRNYHLHHGLPKLKNGKYAWIAVTEWLYESNIGRTEAGKKGFKANSLKK
jgi:hypothetical protein